MSVTELPNVFDGPNVMPDPQPLEEFSCVKCGQTLIYSGRGRKPKNCSETNNGDPDCYGKKAPRSSSSGSGRRASRDVEAATAAIESYYDAFGVVLPVLSPTAAAVLASRIESQNAINRKAFEQSPELAAKFAGGAETVAVTTFVVSNVGLLGSVLFAAWPDIMMLMGKGEDDTVGLFSSFAG